jgi:hypothetical protein
MATWTISTLEHNTADGGVIVAHWQATEADGDYSARSYSTCSFTPDASSPDYVPYDDLTEEMVLGWCFADGVDKDAIEASLTAQIEEQKNPATEDGVPW